MNNICRLCLGGGELFPIFSSCEDLQISFKVMSLSTVQISENDDLPGVVCGSCLKSVNNSYEFKLQCEQSDLQLRQKLLINHDFPKITGGETNATSNSDLSAFSKYDDKLHDRLESEPQDNDTENAPSSNKSILFHPNTGDNIQQLRIEKEPKDKGRAHTHHSKKRKCKLIVDNVKHIEKLKDYSEDHPKMKRDAVSTSTQCYTCGKLVSSRFRLKCHMRIHTGEKPYSCQYCNKDFTLAYNLKVHERIHTGEKPLLCGICGKTFAQSAGLVAHSRLHTGETPYKCKLCPMQFKTCSHLQYHVRLHTGEKNFECEVCNRAFITKGDLTQHHKTHTGERTHICAVCGLRLTRSYHLTRHMLTHTGEKPHRCTICGTAYAQKGDLVRHIKKHDTETQRHGFVNQSSNNNARNLKQETIPINSNNSERSKIKTTQEAPVIDSRFLQDHRTALGLGVGLNLFHQLV